MDKLKGSGSTFSTSGKRWRPFNYNPTIASRNARLHRLKRKGLTPSSDKASARAACQAAAVEHPITRIPTGKRTRSRPE